VQEVSALKALAERRYADPFNEFQEEEVSPSSVEEEPSSTLKRGKSAFLKMDPKIIEHDEHANYTESQIFSS